MNIDVSVCAFVILLVVLTLHLSKRTYKIRRSKVFTAIIVAELLTVACYGAVAGCVAAGLDEGSLLLCVCVDLYFTFRYLVPLLFMYYMVVWAGRKIQTNWLTFVLFMIPVMTYSVMIGWNYATQDLYWTNVYSVQIDATGLTVLNIMSVYCILFGLVYAVLHMQLFSFGKLTMVAATAVGVGMAITFQTYHHSAMFIDFVVAVSLLILYQVAQNPSDMLDSNTQVLSRNVMDENLQYDILNHRYFDLIVIAMDDFKFVNKTFGLAVGDMVLLQIANFLTTLTQKGTVYRYGADQFAVQVEHDETELSRILYEVQERLRHPWITEDVSVMTSATISCIAYPEDGDSLETIVDVIDFSVLSAKKNGKGSLVYARDMDLHALRKEKAIEKAVEQAIDQDTFEVYYQPIYSTEKQCYTSAEALVRIQDDTLGNISPEIFIPIAEKNGSIVRLGTMIFERVCRFIAENNLKETSIEYIEVNVSVVQCMQQDFVEQLSEIMERYGVSPEQINLEVTETAAVDSVAVLQENIEKLYARGISFSLDDYGSGYSTIGYIHRLPFKIIKLDKLMVWDAFENERAGITLRFTVGMLKELKVRIVAEGVETQEQQAHLARIGCDYLQGWYYSKAIPAIEFAALIRQSAE